MPKFRMSPTIHSEKVHTARIAAGTNTASAANTYTDAEVGKIVKFVGDSRFALAAAGDPIEGFIHSMNPGRYDDYSLGGVVKTGYVEVTFDGLEATPGTGTVAVGDYVVTGTVVAAGTALSSTVPAKVCKATNQPGATITTADNTKASIDTALAALVDAESNSRFAWRVVSLGSAGTGAVGTVGVIERVSVAS